MLFCNKKKFSFTGQGAAAIWVRHRGKHADLTKILMVQINKGTGEISPIQVIQNIPHKLLKTA